MADVSCNLHVRISLYTAAAGVASLCLLFVGQVDDTAAGRSLHSLSCLGVMFVFFLYAPLPFLRDLLRITAACWRVSDTAETNGLLTCWTDWLSAVGHAHVAADVLRYCLNTWMPRRAANSSVMSCWHFVSLQKILNLRTPYAGLQPGICHRCSKPNAIFIMPPPSVVWPEA